jgi:hypothetical protein
LIPVCYVPVAVGGQGNCADSWDPSSLIFDPSFAENQPCTTPNRANETLPCPYDAVCWIHIEE